MKLTPQVARILHKDAVVPRGRGSVAGSVLIIVLWVALGLVSITLYFASSMSFELRAADNRVSAVAANQAIEGGARYVASVLSTLATNGTVPDVSTYLSAAVPVGDSHFWLIGRAGDLKSQMQPDNVFFGLVDEGSKLNLNTTAAAMLASLTNMTPELAANIYDWSHTNSTPSQNGDGPMVYAQLQPGYLCKQAPFETIDELRLVYPTDLGTLVGEDFNRNNALDPSETDTNRNNVVDPGILEFVTVYSREPNTASGGAQRVNVSTVNTGSSQLRELLRTNLSTARFNVVSLALGLTAANGPGRGQTQAGQNQAGQNQTGQTQGGQQPVAVATTRRYTSPLAFYLASTMTADEFALIANSITIASGTYIHGRVNVNTASPTVLSCLVEGDDTQVQQLVNYRQTNPDKLTSVAWVVDALGRANATRLAVNDSITAQSYQFTADIAAVGPFGRGYRRVKYVFDTSSGTPEIVYRQDLSNLGWALGKYARLDWAMPNMQRN